MTSDDQEREEEVESVDEQAQDDLETLNRSMIDKTTHIVTDSEAASDLWPQFRQSVFDYKRKRSKILDSRNPHSPKTMLSKPEPTTESERHDDFKHTIPKENIHIQWPLSSAIQDYLQIDVTSTGVVIQNKQAIASRRILSTLHIQGELLYHQSGRSSPG
ncbi:hypothetical protein BDV96DRAFT_569581 [Lophiotrema nucula]|uniref:Uncharacterized protein n=1 Tax=Lophiotrema nucula TaxID=690887 RepID=A0A6A5ZH99_9PLEO|nr:hypothetical protein BDV96DRAFT_569581 [Lophiotrema nucula]